MFLPAADFLAIGRHLNGNERQSGGGSVLTVEITRASVVRIVRFEVATHDRGKGPVFQLTSNSLF